MTTFAPASSGSILAFLVRALNLRATDTDGELMRSNARRYLRGERVSQKEEERVHRALASALVEANLIPKTLDTRPLIHPDRLETAPLSPEQLEAPSEPVVARLITAYARHWDALAAALRHRTAPIAFPAQMIGACIRLLVADLAVRTCGLLWLDRERGKTPLPSFWLEDRGIEKWLRSLAHQRGLTRDDLAKEVRVHINTVDGWFDRGVRPSDENLQDLAEVLGENEDDTRRLLRTLRLVFFGRFVVDELDLLSAGQARDAGQRFVRWSNLLLSLVQSSRNKREENNKAMALAVLMGTVHEAAEVRLPWVEDMLKPAWRSEADPAWRTSITAATRSWLDNLQFVAARLGPSAAHEATQLFGSVEHPAVASLLQQLQATPTELQRQPGWAQAQQAVLDAGGPVAATLYKTMAAEAADAKDLLRSLELLQRAVECDVADADAHFRLGAILGQLSDVPAARHELEIASGLAPDWDRPRVEVGIILLNNGRDQEALRHLEKARDELTAKSPWLLFHLAVAQEQVGQDQAAIGTLEALLADQPELGEAHDRLAHLYLVTGEKREGHNHAKKAAHLGHGSVLAAYKDGYYQGSAPKPRPPSILPSSLVQSSARPPVHT